MRPILLASLLLPATAALLGAQQPPEGWRWQLDRPADNVLDAKIPAGSWRVQEMIPGMHVTTGPGANIVAPGEPAAGRFMVDGDLLLFPDAGNGGYGLFVGLPVDGPRDGRASAWIALLVRADGSYAVMQRAAGNTTALVDWTPHDAVVKQTKGVITNHLRISVERDSLRFFANDKRLGAIARGGLPADGYFGLRIEEGVNLHVTNVDVVRRLLKSR